MNNSKMYDLAIIAAFAALVVVLDGVVTPTGGLGVPVVLQSTGIVLTGTILGFKRGGFATILFLTADLMGVPNMMGWRPFLAALSSSIVGYIVGYLVAGFVAGAATQQAPRTKVSRISVSTGAGLVGVLLQYFLGPTGLTWRMGLSFIDTLITNAPFVPGDVAKTAVAALITIAILQVFLDLLSGVANRKQSRLVKEATTSDSQLTGLERSSSHTMSTIAFDRVSATYSGCQILGPTILVLIENRTDTIGENGDGKPTLVRFTNGPGPVIGGTVAYEDMSAAEQAKAIRKKVGFIFFDADNQIMIPTVAEDIAFSLRKQKLPKDERNQLMQEALERFGFADHIDVSPYVLLGRQKQSPALAVVLIPNLTTIIADESTMFLNLHNRLHTWKIFAQLER